MNVYSLSSNRFTLINWKVFRYSIQISSSVLQDTSTVSREETSCAKSKESGTLLFFFFQMFSKCFQLSFCPVCPPKPSQATNTLHFNLVFWVYSLKKTFLQDYIHSWLEHSHLAFLWGVYLNLFPQCSFPLFLSISLNCLLCTLWLEGIQSMQKCNHSVSLTTSLSSFWRSCNNVSKINHPDLLHDIIRWSKSYWNVSCRVANLQNIQ